MTELDLGLGNPYTKGMLAWIETAGLTYEDEVLMVKTRVVVGKYDSIPKVQERLVEVYLMRY